MSAVELFEFQNQPVRFVIIEGEPHPVLADLCGALDIENSRNVAARLDSLNVRRADVENSRGQVRQTVVVTEAGMYEVIFRSDKPEAIEFRRWVTGEVLPQIRRTGVYGAPAVDLSDPLAAIEAANERSQQAVEVAKAERTRADKAEKTLEVEQRHRRAIEAGDGIHLTDFGKKYFSDVPARKLDDHLYSHGWLIDQRNSRVRPDGEIRDGYDHRKPTAKGRSYIYDHDQGNHGGRRRFQARVRPQKEIEFRDRLAAEGLPVNEHSIGLVLLTGDEIKQLGTA